MPDTMRRHHRIRPFEERSGVSRTATLRTKEVLSMLRARGIEARIVGSMARGEFDGHSDVDFLITALPDEKLRYRIEVDVEEVMGDIPFDVIYFDEVTSDYYRSVLMEEAVDATDLAR